MLTTQGHTSRVQHSKAKQQATAAVSMSYRLDTPKQTRSGIQTDTYSKHDAIIREAVRGWGG